MRAAIRSASLRLAPSLRSFAMPARRFAAARAPYNPFFVVCSTTPLRFLLFYIHKVESAKVEMDAPNANVVLYRSGGKLYWGPEIGPDPESEGVYVDASRRRPHTTTFSIALLIITSIGFISIVAFNTGRMFADVSTQFACNNTDMLQIPCYAYTFKGHVVGEYSAVPLPGTFGRILANVSWPSLLLFALAIIVLCVIAANRLTLGESYVEAARDAHKARATQPATPV